MHDGKDYGRRHISPVTWGVKAHQCTHAFCDFVATNSAWNLLRLSLGIFSERSRLTSSSVQLLCDLTTLVQLAVGGSRNFLLTLAEPWEVGVPH